MEQQNITYFSREPEESNSQDQFHPNQVDFHANSNTNFLVQSGRNFGGSSRRAFVTTNPRQHIVVQQSPVSLPQKIIPPTTPVHVQLVPQENNALTNQQHIIISSQPLKANTPNSDTDTNPITAFMEYFVEQQQQPGCSSNIQTLPPLRTQLMDTKYGLKGKALSVYEKCVGKAEKDAMKRAKQAEAARQRYHRLTMEEKKALNLKRTLAQKRKKQREKEMAQLEALLRASGDIYDDPDVLVQLREKRMRAKWAEAARNRYQRMSEEERRMHNMRRRIKQVTTKPEESNETSMDEESQRRIKEQNEKKAAAARLRYHRMATDEKKLYNQRRTEAFRRRRMEEEALLAMPIGRINGEALDRAQQIVIRNAKRAEAARLRYQRMTPDERRAYNQKRYTPKRKRQMMAMIIAETDEDEVKLAKTEGDEEFDALSSLERDVLRRTQQAQQALLRQRTQQQTQQVVGTLPGGGGGVILQPTGATSSHIVQPQQQQSISGPSRSSQQQIIVQPSGAANEIVSQQIQYITTSSGGNNPAGARILQSSAQQVTYVTTASTPHQTQRA